MITDGIRSLAEFDISTTLGTLSLSLAAQSGYLLSLEIACKGQSKGQSKEQDKEQRNRIKKGFSDGWNSSETVSTRDRATNVLSPSSRIAETDRLLFLQTKQELLEYFSGLRRQFSLPFDIDQLPGTDFQKQVWSQLRQIPYGEIQTYGQIACALGRPTAARAVGQAIHRNPILLLIPCHRVIGSNGRLTGFRVGLPLKQYFLTLENAAHNGTVADVFDGRKLRR